METWERQTDTPAAELDALKARYFEVLEGLIQEDEAVRMDVGHLYEQAVLWKLTHNRIITQEYHGQRRDGKSTANLEDMRRVNLWYEEHWDAEKNKPTEEKGKGKKINNYECIAMDQTEGLRKLIRGEKEAMYVIDEHSALANTGSNMTTEIAAFRFVSDTKAVHRQHVGYCSPSGLIDSNSDVIMEVIGRDDTRKMTKVKVKYRDIATGDIRTIGHRWIDVTETLKADWYQQYGEKKERRLNLLDKHNIRDPREMEQYYLTARIIENMQDDVTELGKHVGGLPTASAAILELREETLKLKSLYSSEHRDNIIRDVMTVLEMIWVIKQYQKKLRDPKNYHMKESLKNVLAKNVKRFNKAIKQYENYVKVYNEYHKIT